MIYLSKPNSRNKKECFDFDWHFSRGDFEGASNIDFDIKTWEQVDIPHDFAIRGPFTLDKDQKENPQDFTDWQTPQGYADWQTGNLNGYLPGGIGWYRKSFFVSEEAKGKKLFLEFEGIYRNADIWLNGNHIKNQRNGYLGFHIDITKHIKFNEKNILAVRCDNSPKDTSRWYTGSGIYRHCYICSYEPIYIPQNNIYITTPNISLERASVQLEAKIYNSTAKDEWCKAEIDIIDSYGKCVSSAASAFEVKARELFVINNLLFVIDPQLWSIESPTLYKALVKLFVNENLMGEYENTFGIRHVEFIAGKGLLINGQKVIAKGVNIHHDLGALGAAAFDNAILRRLELIKEMGCNAIRLSHNPHAPALLDMCDKMGILVYAEAFDKLSNQYYGEDIDFEAVWQEDLQTYIERDRNHPCIFIWSVGNEVDQQRFSQDFGVDILQRMVTFAHQFEPSRKVTCALYPARRDAKKWSEADFYESEPAQMSFYMDVLSCNYTWAFFEKDMQKYPQLIPLQSEAAVGYEDLGGWTNYDKKAVVGHLFWGGIDYLGESISWPYKGWYRGFADICGHRRPISYHMEAAFSQKPVVHIGVAFEDSATGIIWNDADLQWKNILSHWNWAEGDKLKIKVYSNQDSVELYLNGKSLGKKYANESKNYIYAFDVDYSAGTLLAVAKENDKVTATHAILTAGEKCRIILDAERAILSADGQDVVHITAKITDAAGVVCPYANDLLEFSVQGAGKLQGVASGDLKSHESFTANAHTAFLGIAQLVVRSAKEPGDIFITAKCAGLETANIIIKAL